MTKEVTGLSSARSGVLFLGTAILAFILIYFGARLLFVDTNIISTTLYWLFAGGLFIGSLALLFTERTTKKIQISLGLFGLAAYSLLRALSVVQMPWLSIVIGLICWLAAVALLYIAHPNYGK